MKKQHFKRNKDKIVHAKRFNLAAGAPSRALKDMDEETLSDNQSAQGIRIAEHPILYSVKSGDNPRESLELLPKVDRIDAPIFSDRMDANLFWYLPDYILNEQNYQFSYWKTAHQITNSEGIEVDEIQGVVKIFYLKTKGAGTMSEWAKTLQISPNAQLKEVPFTLKEVFLNVMYEEEGATKFLALNGMINEVEQSLTFQLKDDALRVAYFNLAKDKSATVRFIGDFNGWKHTQETVENTEATNNNFFTFRSVQNKAYLQTERIQSGANVMQGELPNQRENIVWEIVPDGDFFRIKIKNEAYYLEVKNNSDKKKTNVIINTHRDAKAQLWTLQANKDKSHTIISALNSLAVSTDKKNATDTNLVLRRHRKQSDISFQKWYINPPFSAEQVRDDFIENNNKKPIIKDVWTKQRFIVEKETIADFPCERYQDTYVQYIEDKPVSFACHPEWQNPNTLGKLFELIQLTDKQVNGRVYRSLIETNKFVFVPDKYVIARDEDGKVAVKLHSVIDPEGVHDNQAIFYVTARPDISLFEMTDLKLKLMQQFSMSEMPEIIYPTDLGTSHECEWGSPQCSLTSCTLDGVHFVLEIHCDDLNSAVLSQAALNGNGGYLGGSIIFPLDEETTEKSSFFLNINQTQYLITHKFYINLNKSQIQFRNISHNTLDLTGILYFNPETGSHFYHRLSDKATLYAQDTVGFKVPSEVIQLNLNEALAHSELAKETGGAFDEERLELDLITLEIPVFTTINPTLYHIQKIDVEARFTETKESEKITLQAVNDSFASVNEMMWFALPLSRYLMPEKRILEYRFTLHFSDYQENIQSEWLVQNIGDEPRIEIKRELVKALISENVQANSFAL